MIIIISIIVNIDPVLYIGISQSFFAGLLISTKKPFTIANRLMASWLFLICAELLFTLVNNKLLEIYSFPVVAFTYGPLLYLYVKFMTRPDMKFNWFALFHFMPFVIFLTVSVIFRAQPLLEDLKSFFVRDRFISLRIVYGFSFFLSVTAYSILAFIEIKRHQNNLMNLVSYTSGILTLNWLKIISVSFYAAYFILFILGGLNILGNYIPFDPYFVIFGFITLFSFVYSFYAIRQPVIFGQELKPEAVDKTEQEKYVKSGLKEEQANKYLRNLISFVEEKKPYLDRDLTIQDLSAMTSIPRHYITQILNEKHKKNFFTFINEYRVKEVIERFSDHRYNNYTILAIAFDAGFNSKTTFNSFFKSHTGLTPREYREKASGISA